MPSLTPDGFSLGDVPFIREAGIGVLALLALFALWQRVVRTRLDLPPGPPGHWFWGNTIPDKHSFLKFTEWTEQYGPIFSLRCGLRTIVVLGTFQSAMDILEKEGAVSADRPRLVAGDEMMSGNMRVLLVGANERLRRLRRALHAHLQPKVAATYEPLQMLNSKVLIRDILDDPSGHYDHAKRYAASVILSLTYGKPSPSFKSDPDVVLVTQCLMRLGAAIRPGAHLVEHLPWLQYIPFYGKTLRQYHREELDLFRRQLRETRQQMAMGKAPSSFGKYLLERQQELSLSDDEIAYLCGSMFGAGSETTAAGISTVIQAAACHPAAQARVQEELDRVVGRDRLPSFNDLDDLPEVQAFFLETFRWRPGAPGGLQHRATKEIVYQGYRIPAGATVIGNHWSIGRDPALFPDGNTFRPERWLDEDGRIRTDLRFPNFGFGRRVCPGSPVAQRSLYINTACILWAFSISQDPLRPIDTLAIGEGVTAHPLPFVARFAPRHSPDMIKALLAEES
ncbi:cytochrome P450 [Dentipellis sp. KUC8613]|nr:cytochrome P450 [Dentipellis sp. KUC8613]